MKKNIWTIIGVTMCCLNVLLLTGIDGYAKHFKTERQGNFLSKISAYQSHQSSADSSGVLKVRELQIVDESGNAAITLSADQDGGLIFVNNSMGEVSTIVGVSDTKGGFIFTFAPNPEMGLAGLGAENGVGGGLFAVSSNGSSLQTGSEIGITSETEIEESETVSEISVVYLGIDPEGNGVAETRGKEGQLRWSSEQSTGQQSGLIGDLDNDGDVDFNDFILFTANFGRTN